MSKTYYIFDSDALKNFHKRIFFSITIFLFVFVVALYRIMDVMILDKKLHKFYKVQELVERGNIYDRNGYLLSSTIESYSLSANRLNIKNKKYLSKKLSSILSLSENEIFNNLNDEKKYFIKRNISPKEYQKIIDLGEVELIVEKEKKRFYPFSNASSHVVGYTDSDGIGLSGIERGLESILKQGKDVHLSIDINLQQAVRNELIETINKFSAIAGNVIVIDILNREIIAMNSYPDFDPNNRSTFNEQNLFNRAIEANYEMGSMFKMLTIAMGIDKEIINSSMTFDVTKNIRGIKDFHPHKGELTITGCMVKSSNICTAKIASKIGKTNQKDFFKKIGFNDKISFAIKEAAKPLGNKNNWGELETMTIGFGHGFAITPLHLANAYVTMVHKGLNAQPKIIKNRINEEKNIFIKNQTSKYIIDLLRAVILETEYTGPRVKIPGYEIGGKTGTTELLDENGKYLKDENLTSFVAVFPTSKPRYVVLAMVENPKKIKEENYSITGATVAAPLVKNIISRMIEIIGIPPNNKNEILKADTSKDYKIASNAVF